MKPSIPFTTPGLAVLAAGLLAGSLVLAAEPATEPDGMGHLPDHQHQAAGEGAADGDHHAHGQAAGDDDEGEACAMDDSDGHGHGEEQHHAMMMKMMGGGHDGGHGAHQHGAGGDETLAAVAAPAPPRWLRGIELDEAQQDRIFEILHESAAVQRKAQRTADRTHKQLAHIGMSGDYSEAQARKLSDQHAQAIAELTMLRVRNEKRILEVLKPEQRRDAAHQAARDD